MRNWFIALFLVLTASIYAEDLDQLILDAATRGDAVQIAKLWDKGANVNCQNADGRTPLMIATRGNHGDAVEALLQRNANPELKDLNGKTALDYAPSDRIKNLVQIALKHAAKSPPPPPPPPAADPVETPSTSRVDKSDIKQFVLKSTVTIETSNGSGSGFVYREGDAFWLVSNTHVLSGSTAVTNLNIRDIDSKVIPLTGEMKANLDADIAMLRIKPEFKTKYFLSSAAEVQTGEKISVAGNAQGVGIISFLEGKVAGLGSFHSVPIIESSAKFVPGCSGGPIINSSGDLIAISTYMMMPMKSSSASLFQDSSFTKPRRIGVRASEIKNCKSMDFPLLFLFHKATEDRLEIFQMYANFLKAKNADATAAEVKAFLALADKTVFKDRSFEGTRPSGMLETYYDAATRLSGMALAYGKKKAGTSTIKSGNLAGENRALVQALKFKKDSIFIEKDVHAAIDQNLEVLEKLGEELFKEASPFK
jgi:S1-C subfamily serine protease